MNENNLNKEKNRVLAMNEIQAIMARNTETLDAMRQVSNEIRAVLDKYGLDLNEGRTVTHDVHNHLNRQGQG